MLGSFTLKTSVLASLLNQYSVIHQPCNKSYHIEAYNVCWSCFVEAWIEYLVFPHWQKWDGGDHIRNSFQYITVQFNILQGCFSSIYQFKVLRECVRVFLSQYIFSGVGYRQWEGEETSYRWSQSHVTVRGGFKATRWDAAAVQASDARRSVPFLGFLQGALSWKPPWYACYTNSISCYNSTNGTDGAFDI